jgi:signal transduction histidine kinase
METSWSSMTHRVSTARLVPSSPRRAIPCRSPERSRLAPGNDDGAAETTYRVTVRALRLLRDHADVAFAVAICLAMEIEVWTASYAEHRPLLALAVLLTTLPLAVRCRQPLLTLIAVFVGLRLCSAASPDFDNRSVTLVIVFVFVLYSYGANARGWQAWAAVAVIPACIAMFVTDDGDPFAIGDVAFGAMLVGGPWAAGVALRLRRQSESRLAQRTVELEHEREAKARAAVAEERARIARELHDVVAHAISVVVLQARGGRRRLESDPAEARAAFDAIERTGEQALGEMRRLLGMLRESDDELARAPQPSLARLQSLADEVRSSGLPVDLEIEGEPVELPPGVDLSAYRIVQEALTNALKHAGPARARVRVSYEPQAVELEVTDDGRGNGAGAGSGHGLVGIRERVAVVGGKLDAGPRPDGGYAVRVVLPYESER